MSAAVVMDAAQFSVFDKANKSFAPVVLGPVTRKTPGGYWLDVTEDGIARLRALGLAWRGPRRVHGSDEHALKARVYARVIGANR